MNSSLQMIKFILIVVSLIISVVAIIIRKIIFRDYTPKEMQENMGPRIFIAIIMLIWAVTLIVVLLSYRDYL